MGEGPLYYTCDIGDVTVGQDPLLMIWRLYRYGMVQYLLYRGCTGRSWAWSFDIVVVTVGQDPVLVIWGCTCYGRVQYL